jgi:hypothetical protein
MVFAAPFAPARYKLHRLPSLLAASALITGRNDERLRAYSAFVLAAHDHDRARRVMHAELADGSQRRPGEPAVAPAADYEQFGLFGRIHQHLPDSPFYHARTDLDIWADGAHLGDRWLASGRPR